MPSKPLRNDVKHVCREAGPPAALPVLIGTPPNTPAGGGRLGLPRRGLGDAADLHGAEVARPLRGC